MPTWTDVWAECTDQLGDSLEARRMVEHVSGRSRSSWLMTLSDAAPTIAIEDVNRLVDRRLKGEPLQHILGRWGFRTLDLKVDKRALIPRPETEQVVEASIKLIADVEDPLIVDLGTGTGAIALSLATELVGATVWAVDISPDALELARENCASMNSSIGARVNFVQGSWFEALSEDLRGCIDLVITNPPYVAESEALDAQVLDWDPHLALFSGSEGLDAITNILGNTCEWLRPGGTFITELAPRQTAKIADLAKESGLENIKTGFDLAGQPRWVSARKPAPHLRLTSLFGS